MKLVKKLFLVLSLLAISQSLYSLTPEETKNTALIDESIESVFKYGISIGMTYIETHIIKNMVHYAPTGAIKNLLKALFWAESGELRISNRIPTKQLTIASIGTIINQIFIQNKLNNNDKIAAKLFPGKKNKENRTIVNLIAKALQEEEESSFYQKDTVLNILYSFVYKKAQNKNDLKPYFDALCKNDTWKNANPTKQKNWENDVFGKNTLKKTKIDIEQQEDFLKTISIGIKQNWLNFSIPKLIEYDTAKPNNGITSFSDCFETTLHNICNILAYNENVISLENLAKQLKKKPSELPQEIQYFYTNDENISQKKKFSTQEEEKKKENIHNKWIDDVLKTNILYAFYSKLIDKNGKEVKIKEGCICIPSTSTLLQNKSPDKNGFYDITLQGTKHKAFINKSRYLGYELTPCTHELIITLNHILNLNIFKEKDPETEINQKDFEKIYIKKIFAAINTKGHKEKTSKNVDLYTITPTEEKTFQIKITRNVHAHIIPNKKRQSPSFNTNKDYIEKWYPNINDKNDIKQKIIYHAFDIKNDYYKNEQIFRSDMENNLKKIETISYISKQEINHNHKKIIKNILKEFHLVRNDWNDYKSLINSIDKKNNVIKKIINDEISEIHKKQLQTNPFLLETSIRLAPEIALSTLKKLQKEERNNLITKKMNGFNSLALAIIYNKANIANYIIAELDNDKDFTTGTDKTEPPLHKAIQFKRCKVLEAIIEKLKNIDKSGKTLKDAINKNKLLQQAINSNQLKIVQCIINTLKSVDESNEVLIETLRNNITSTHIHEELFMYIYQELNDLNNSDSKKATNANIKHIIPKINPTDKKRLCTKNSTPQQKREMLDKNPTTKPNLKNKKTNKFASKIAGAIAFILSSTLQKFAQKKTTTKSIAHGSLAAVIAWITSKITMLKIKGLPTRKQLALNCALSTTIGTIAAPKLTKYGYKFYKKIQQKWTENKRPITISSEACHGLKAMASR